MTDRPLWHHGAASLAALAMLFFAFVLGRDVPLLGLVDLGFHELGHLITTPLGKTMSFLMGSGTQILVPAGLAAYFWWARRDSLATGLMLAWTASSMQDVSVYVADGPYQLLPLIGGSHDWAFLLNRWGIMHRAEDVAGMVWTIGVVTGIAGLAVIVGPPIERRLNRRTPEPADIDISSLPVRDPRPPA